MRSAPAVALSLAALLALGFGIQQGHRHTDAWASPARAEQAVGYLPSGRFLKAVSLGYEPLIADLLWVRAVLLFGERYGVDGDQDWYGWLFHMMDLATDLDPSFRAAYKYGGTMLRVDGRAVDQSSLIFQKGMRNLPEDWVLPFGISMNYFLYKDDSQIAARYMQMAAKAGGGPPHLHGLAASLLSETGRLDVAYQFLLEELRGLPEGHAKDAVRVKIFETRYLIAKRDAEEVVAQYRRARGALPDRPEGVAELGLELPDDPLDDVARVLEVDLGPLPPLQGGWVWDADGAPGELTSAAHEVVWTRIAKVTGFGRAAFAEDE